MYVIPKSFIMKLGVVVFAVTIATIDCYDSLHELRKRMPRHTNEFADLIKKFQSDEKFYSKYQNNSHTEEILSFATSEEFQIYSVHLMAGARNLTFANTCYEHFVDNLVTYVTVAVKLIQTVTIEQVDQRMIDTMRFNTDHVYCLLTFLFDIGIRKLDLIFETVQFLQTLPNSAPANSKRFASLLLNALQKFLKEYPSTLTNQGLIDLSSITPDQLKEKLLEIEREVSKFSYNFCSMTYKPLNFYYQNVMDATTDSKQPMSFTNYVYENEVCMIHVSITNTFLIIRIKLGRGFLTISFDTF